MKIIFIRLLFCLVATVSYCTVSAQVTVSAKNQKIRQIMQQIEKNSEYSFFYSDNFLDLNREVSVDIKDESIESALNKLFKGTNIMYSIGADKHIVLAADTKTASATPMKNYSGTISANNGEPITGASVVVKGSQTVSMTDTEGKFSIAAPLGSTLMVSYVGYVTREIKLDNTVNINIVMQEDLSLLDEVVVVGYGVQKKVNLTGSVSSVNADKIESRSSPNLSSMLTGLASGVTVRQSSGNPGSDGANIRIRGIGTFSGDYRSPLVIIDGAVADMNSVNPEDVENVSVLKDAASASIYGARGANGVILVTTKKGSRNAAPRVTYTGMITQEKANGIFEFLTDYADYMELYNMAELSNNPSVSNKYDWDEIAAWRAAKANPNGIYTDPNTGNQVPNYLAYPNTNWSELLFVPNYSQKHNLSISGGSQNSNYLFSLGYLDNPGTLENTGMNRFNIRVNAESKITEFLKIGTQTYAMRQRKDPGDVGQLNTNRFQAVGGMTAIHDGKYGGPESPKEKSDVANPLKNINLIGGKNTTTRINTTWFADLSLFNSLVVRGSINYQNYFYDSKTHSRHLDDYSFRKGSIYRPGVILDNATTSRTANRSEQYTATLTANYNIKLCEHHELNALLGYEQFYYNTSGFSGSRKGLLNFDITDITTATNPDEDKVGGSVEQDYAMVSFFGRLNYAYRNRYLFEANFRRDASSRFSPDNRWGTFPSFSLGWKVSEESFFEPVKNIVNTLKIRASWGRLGNTTSGYYDWQATYAKVYYVFDNKTSDGMAIDKIANPMLQWESVTSQGIAFEASFLKSRLNFEFDLYDKLTKGILTSPSIYLTMGMAGAPTKNTSDMRNRGFEITAGWRDKIADFHYSISGNFSYNQNRVVKYLGKLKEGWVENNGVSSYESNMGQVSMSGSETGSIRLEDHLFDEYYLRTYYSGTGTYHLGDGSVDPDGGPKDGMIRSEADLTWVRDMMAAGYSFNGASVNQNGGLWYGEYLFADLNGDKNHGNNYDRRFSGKSSAPKYNFGLSISAEWKGIDLNMTWAGATGFWYYLHARGANMNYLTTQTDVLPIDARNRFYYLAYDKTTGAPIWDDPSNNLTGKYARLRTGSAPPYVANEQYLYNASYIKLKTLQIGYTLPKKWTDKIFVNSLRFFVSGENLLTITNYPGVDPEQGAGVDVYPISRQLSIGVNLSF
ncbi:MAG: TonB-dependent receptor [Prevotellaceae bacterium]|jgi:TonB-linked SusC/RagA family outer membrane protein|nr:TonB-dependent receptor [Prevotellaceae bacterium]